MFDFSRVRIGRKIGDKTWASIGRSGIYASHKFGKYRLSTFKPFRRSRRKSSAESIDTGYSTGLSQVHTLFDPAERVAWKWSFIIFLVMWGILFATGFSFWWWVIGSVGCWFVYQQKVNEALVKYKDVYCTDPPAKLKYVYPFFPLMILFFSPGGWIVMFIMFILLAAIGG